MGFRAYTHTPLDMKVLTLFSILGFASAACPNNCAGHGTCGEATQCDCYRNWFGADCSKRICTFSAAFVDTPVGDLNGDGEHGPARYFDPGVQKALKVQYFYNPKTSSKTS